jgi:hypothetical protein
MLFFPIPEVQKVSDCVCGVRMWVLFGSGCVLSRSSRQRWSPGPNDMSSSGVERMQIDAVSLVYILISDLVERVCGMRFAEYRMM